MPLYPLAPALVASANARVWHGVAVPMAIRENRTRPSGCEATRLARKGHTVLEAKGHAGHAQRGLRVRVRNGFSPPEVSPGQLVGWARQVNLAAIRRVLK